ncbi:MAG: type II secretion system protein N [Pseudomonadota bacterium]
MVLSGILAGWAADGWVWAGRILAVAAVTVIAITAASLFWVITIGPDAYIRVATPRASAGAAGVANVDYSILSRVTPFRTVTSSDTASGTRRPANDIIVEDVAETTLDLKLHGLISESEEGGHAFISTDGGVQTAYAVGDEIDGAPGVTLERLRVDSVLLRRNGVLESLTYETDGAAITTLSAVDSLDPQAIEEEAETRPPQAITALGSNGKPIDSSRIDKIASATEDRAPVGAETKQTPVRPTPEGPVIVRRMTRNELETMAVSIRLEENQDTGDGGLYVFPTGNIDTFSKSGLQAGDIITEVAGLKLDNRSDFERLLAEVEAQRQINLVIVRAQVTRTLRVTIIE